MICYALRCESNHEFEAWFANSAAYDTLSRAGHVACTVCGTARVGKAVMTPSVARRRKEEAAQAASSSDSERSPREPDSIGGAQVKLPFSELKEALRGLRSYVENHAEHVGSRFAEEARKIHYGEAENRGIYGEASADEAKALRVEGVEFLPLPPLPDELN
jgi:hypothetical protein